MSKLIDEARLQLRLWAAGRADKDDLETILAPLAEVVELGEALLALLADGHCYTLSTLSNGHYDVSWWDGLPYGVEGATLLGAIVEARELRKEQSDVQTD